MPKAKPAKGKKPQPAKSVKKKGSKKQPAPVITLQQPQQKAAVRSEAFAKAILEAKTYASDPESLLVLFQEASDKAATIPESSLRELGPYLQTMLRLIRDYAEGRYTQIPRDNLLTIVAAVSYLIDPFDLIPDEIPFLGYIDDATVIEFAVARTHGALRAFMLWETQPH